MSFNIVRYKVYRAVSTSLHCSFDHPDLHHVMALRLYRTEDDAQTVADRLNAFQVSTVWHVEPIHIQMTEDEHGDYEAWMGWSE